MNELLELLSLIDEAKKTQAQKLVDAVKLKIDGLDLKINEQERLKIDAIKTRDEIKGKLKDISIKLGVDADNVVDAIETIKSKKGVDKTEALEIAEKEKENLKLEITQLTQQLQEVETKSTQELLSLNLKSEVAISLPKHNAKKNAYNYIITEVQKKAQYENGKTIFKNEDGTTLRIDGRDATADDIIKQMFETEKTSNESMFFDIAVQQSGASNNQSGKIVEDLILD
jgi:hypothetical protein